MASNRITSDGLQPNRWPPTELLADGLQPNRWPPTELLVMASNLINGLQPNY